MSEFAVNTHVEPFKSDQWLSKISKIHRDFSIIEEMKILIKSFIFASFISPLSAKLMQI